MLINSENGNYNVIKIFFLCLTGFILGRLFVFPGFLDPFAPSHSDLYRYFLISQDQWISNGQLIWLMPRPLMIAFLHFLGILHYQEFIWLALSLTSVAFATALIFLLQRFGGLKLNIPLVLLYSIVIFSLPSSFEVHQLDYGGMLAGILSVSAIYVWFRFNSSNPLRAFFLALLLYWFSLEMKPTFAVTVLLLALIQTLVSKNKKTLLLFIGVFCVSIFVVLKDYLLGSPFIGFSGGAGVYSVHFNLWQNLGALWVYLKSSVPYALLPSLGVAYYLLWRATNQKLSILIALIFLAISAVIPMTFIPNRVMTLYSWYSGVLLCIPFLYILQAAVGSPLPFTLTLISEKIRRGIIFICLITAFIGLSSLNHYYSLGRYYYGVSNYNKNVMDSMEELQKFSSKPLLIAGLQGPYHPFKNTAFIERVYPQMGQFDVLLRKSEKAWNNMSTEQTNGVYLAKLNFERYSEVYIFDNDGKIASKHEIGEIRNMPAYQRDALLFCGMNNISDPTSIARSIECLNSEGEYKSSINLGLASSLGEQQPWIYFHLAKSYLAVGDQQKAREFLKMALAKDPGNQLFKSTMSEVELEINKGEQHVTK